MSTFTRKHAEMALAFWVAYLRPMTAPFPPEMRQLMLLDLILIHKLGLAPEIDFIPEQIMKEASDETARVSAPAQPSGPAPSH